MRFFIASNVCIVIPGLNPYCLYAIKELIN
nr:MAG TPA: hypothetical protein [Bacteriophage sp.]